MINMDAAMKRILYALRTLSKTPLVTMVVVVSLGLGIGANTAIFSLLDQVILRLLPVERRERRGCPRLWLLAGPAGQPAGCLERADPRERARIHDRRGRPSELHQHNAWPGSGRVRTHLVQSPVDAGLEGNRSVRRLLDLS